MREISLMQILKNQDEYRLEPLTILQQLNFF